MKRSRGYSLIEIMIVISIINILAASAIALYADYTKKARTAEVPLMLKHVVMMIHEWEMQLAAKNQKLPMSQCGVVDSNGRCEGNFPDFVQDLVAGNRAKNASYTLPFGNFFEFKIQFPTDCGPENLDRMAYAVPIIKADVPQNYQIACMNDKFEIYNAEQANNPGGGKPDGPGGGKPDDNPGKGKP
jgi:prepilin-type N-terminal cleavage/methylation domain-containing protein